MYIAIIIGLVLLGVFFVLLELFFLPGISLAAIGGIGCLVAATITAYQHIHPLAGHITLAAAFIATAFCIYCFFRSRALDKMALRSEIDSKIDEPQNQKVALGDRGVCLSRLAPAGKIRINGITLEARTENVMLDEGSVVEVIQVNASQVIVKAVQA